MPKEIIGFKNRVLYNGDAVKVYRNLHNGCFSVMRKGLVHAHADMVVLNDVTFTVRQSGWKKVQETGVKNVHAFVNGSLVCDGSPTNYKEMIPVHYNPRKYNFFYIELHGDVIPVVACSKVVLAKGKMFAMLDDEFSTN